MIDVRPALLFCALLASCGTTSTSQQTFELEPLQSLESLDLAYEGTLSSEGLPPSELSFVVGREGEVITVRCEIFAATREAAAELFGDVGFALRAEKVDMETAARLREALEAGPRGQRVQESRMALGRGGSSHLIVADQFAYVDSFALRTLGSTSIGDPQVSYARDGFLLELATDDGEAGTPCQLQVDMHFSELMHPISETTARLPGAAGEVTIQTPVFTTQSVALEAEFLEDSALVVGPIPAFGGNDALIVLLRLEHDPLETPAGE